MAPAGRVDARPCQRVAGPAPSPGALCSRRLALMKIQRLRESWKPGTVKLLFIGESPPHNGSFFYRGDSYLYIYIKSAFETTFDKQWSSRQDFLTFFKKGGCYLVDLCGEPVNHLPRAERRKKRKDGIPHLAREIARIEPTTQVVVMKGIDGEAKKAMRMSGYRSEKTWTLPFPAQGHQPRFVRELTEALCKLRRDGTLIC